MGDAPPPHFLHPPPPPPHPLTTAFPTPLSPHSHPPTPFFSPAPPAAAYVLPKLYTKNYYCVSCAVHSRIVRVRNVFKRRNRDPPAKFKRSEGGRREGGAQKAA